MENMITNFEAELIFNTETFKPQYKISFSCGAEELDDYIKLGDRKQIIEILSDQLKEEFKNWLKQRYKG